MAGLSSILFFRARSLSRENGCFAHSGYGFKSHRVHSKLLAVKLVTFLLVLFFNQTQEEGFGFRCGGIGRRVGLRFQCINMRAGSSPATGCPLTVICFINFS